MSKRKRKSPLPVLETPNVSPETKRTAEDHGVSLVRCPFCRASSVAADSRLRADVRAGVEFARHQCTNSDCRRVFVLKRPLATSQ
jgi:hypothetical protein